MSAPAPCRLHFLVPGALTARTGGTRYDVRLADALTEAGIACGLRGLDGAWPGPDATGAAALAGALSQPGDGGLYVIDGLCLATLATLDAPPYVALMHHPADRETGLEPVHAKRLHALECRALARARWIVATSTHTARLLADAYGVAPARIGVVAPGISVTAGTAPRRRDGAPLRLLAVAGVTPRKGYDVLIDAAATLRRTRPDLPAFRIDCYGSTDRDPALVARLQGMIAANALETLIHFHGEADEPTLAEAYAAADLFVHAAHYEGYGMAVADALAAGLPVVAAAGGAVADLVPECAGLLVPPGDAAALADALASAIGDPARRTALAAGAYVTGTALPDWPAAARRFLAECREAMR